MWTDSLPVEPVEHTCARPMDAAAYLLDQLGPMDGLRLHFLLFEAQRWSVETLEKPLFEDIFLATDAGPLLPAIFERYAPVEYEVRAPDDRINLHFGLSAGHLAPLLAVMNLHRRISTPKLAAIVSKRPVFGDALRADRIIRFDPPTQTLSGQVVQEFRVPYDEAEEAEGIDLRDLTGVSGLYDCA